MKKSKDIIERILESIKDCGYFDSEFETMNIVNFLKMFFDQYEFSDYIKTHFITEDEYKKYFKEDVKQNNPQHHKMCKDIYKLYRKGVLK